MDQELEAQELIEQEEVVEQQPVVEPAPQVPTDEQLQAFAVKQGYVHVSQVQQPQVQTPEPVRELSVSQMVAQQRQQDQQENTYRDEAFYTDMGLSLIEQRQNDRMSTMRQEVQAEVRTEVRAPMLHQTLQGKGMDISYQEAQVALDMATKFLPNQPANLQNDFARIIAQGYAVEAGKVKPQAAAPVTAPRPQPTGEPVTTPIVGRITLTESQERMAKSLFDTFPDVYGTDFMKAKADMIKNKELI